MKAPSSSPPATSGSSDLTLHGWLVGGVIAVAACLAYANTVSAPFVFDDQFAIVDNPSIRHLSAWRDVLSPPAQAAGATGRPVINLSLALNYAIGGLDVRGYHLVNLAIHVLAGLTLFGLVRRTLLRPMLRAKFSAAALPLAGAIALLWTVHPLLTESVTCVIQRSESLAGLFVLLTLYCFARSLDSPRPVRWWIAAALTNLVGMATKEIVAVTPLLVLLYDRAFAAGTFREAWRRRRALLGALAAGWLLLAWLVAGTHGRNGVAGFGEGVGVFDYALTQGWAIPHYLRLSFWPEPLVVDYGMETVKTPVAIVPQLVLLTGALAASAWAVARRPALGFLTAWFFLILAPSSSVVPLVTQTIAEHRMYLPLAAVVTLVVLGLHRYAGMRIIFIVVPLALVLGGLTWRRNETYRSALVLWRDTVEKRPGNARAHYNLGNALRRAGETQEALQHYETAVHLLPGFALLRTNYANTLLKLERLPEAVAQYDELVRANPQLADAWHNRGNALLASGRVDEAIASYREALRLDPAGETQRGLGNALVQARLFPEALEHYEAALRSDPNSASLHGNVANVLFTLGRLDEAQAHYRTALRLDPADADVHANFGHLLLALERPAEALTEFHEALRLRPDSAAARAGLELAEKK